MWALCVVCGEGDKGSGRGWKDSLEICVGYGELSLESDGRNKNGDCIWYVILMEDGCKTQISCVTLLLY